MNDDYTRPALRVVAFVLTSVVLATGWLRLCDVMGWNRLGWAGVLLGVLIGVSLWIGNHASRGFTAGVVAALVAGTAIGISNDRVMQQRSEKAKEDMWSEQSFISALAEQKLAQQAATLAESGNAPPSVVCGAPMVASQSEIPVEILKEAANEWKALPESTKVQVRQQRAHWIEQSHGPASETRRENGRWIIKVCLVFASSGIALVLGAAPALIDRTREVLA